MPKTSHIRIGRHGRFHATPDKSESAIVTKVIDDAHVNLVVVDTMGAVREENSVTVSPDGNPASTSRTFTFGHPADDEGGA